MGAGKITRLTLISTAASLIARGIGLAFSVFLTNKIGASGIGLMTVITSVYSLGVSFSASGYRLATTRLAVEDEQSDSPNPVKLICAILSYAIITGTVSAAVLYFSSEFISLNILEEERCIKALKILSASLPFIALSGVISSYLNAFYKIIKVAVIQFSSQIIQIVFVAIFISRASNITQSCEYIACGSVIGEFTAFLVSLIFLIYELSGKKKNKSKKKIFTPFIRIALPDALGYDLRSGLSTIQHLLIPIGFKKGGIASEAALATYGVLHGMAFQVLLFPSCILRSLASLLVPTVTKIYVSKDSEKIQSTVRKVIHMTVIFSVCVASVMYFESENISHTFYHNSDCAGFLRLFAPLVPIMYLDISVDSMLKGLDRQFASMGYNLLDSFVSVILVYLLLPIYGINGYIIMVFFTETMNTCMSLYKLVSVTKIKISILYDIAVPVLCAIVSGAVSNFFVSYSGLGYSYLSLFLQVLINSVLFFILVFFASTETRKDFAEMFKS